MGDTTRQRLDTAFLVSLLFIGHTFDRGITSVVKNNSICDPVPFLWSAPDQCSRAPYSNRLRLADLPSASPSTRCQCCELYSPIYHSSD